MLAVTGSLQPGGSLIFKKAKKKTPAVTLNFQKRFQKRLIYEESVFPQKK